MKTGLFLLLCVYVSMVSASDLQQIIGTENHDDISGGREADVIYAGDGDDVINGKQGLDILYGGKGSDNFIVDFHDLEYTDQVKDFNEQEGDIITLRFRTPSIKDMSIPKEFGNESVKLDRHGNIKILMDNQRWFSVINVQKTDMYIELENDSNTIRFILKRKL